MNPTTEAGKAHAEAWADAVDIEWGLEPADRETMLGEVAAIEVEAVAVERARIAEAMRRKQDLICSCHLPECPRLAAVLDALGLGQAEFDRLMMAVTRPAKAEET
jgi:hypothetical protein